MVATSLATLYFFSLFLDEERRSTAPMKSLLWCFLSATLFAATLLVKPYMFYLLLPMGYLTWEKLGARALLHKKLYLFILLSVLPLGLWRLWMLQYPEGIPRITWLFNGGNIRFKGAFFHWIVEERLGREILTVGGFALAVVGILWRPKPGQSWMFHWWLVGVFLYVVIIARGNVEHDYYQIPLVPILSVMMARGVEFMLFTARSYFPLFVSAPLALCLVVSIGAFGWYQVRGFYQINHGEIMQAGDVARKILPADARVIAPYTGDTAFLYQLDRPGWPVMYTSLDNLIKLGATHFVSVNFDQDTKEVMNKYTIIYQAPNFVIVDLRKIKTN